VRNFLYAGPAMVRYKVLQGSGHGVPVEFDLIFLIPIPMTRIHANAYEPPNPNIWGGGLSYSLCCMYRAENLFRNGSALNRGDLR